MESVAGQSDFVVPHAAVVPDQVPRQGGGLVLTPKQLKTLVAPYYLKLLGVGVSACSPSLLSKVSRTARKVPDQTVLAMLDADWRTRIMGAWYAIAKNDLAFGPGLHESLLNSLGTLTSPALLVGILRYPQPDSLEVIAIHHRLDVVNQWGGADFIAAAAQLQAARLGIDSPLPAPSEGAVETLSASLAAADRLRTNSRS